jgi:hypothetical protein
MSWLQSIGNTLGEWYESADSMVGGILPGGRDFFTGASGDERALAERRAERDLAGMGHNPYAWGEGPAAPAGGGGCARGRYVTAVAKQMPDGTLVPVAKVDGKPVLYSTDMQACRRVERIAKKAARAIGRKTVAYGARLKKSR